MHYIPLASQVSVASLFVHLAPLCRIVLASHALRICKSTKTSLSYPIYFVYSVIGTIFDKYSAETDMFAEVPWAHDSLWTWTWPLASFLSHLPPANEVCEGYVFTRVCQSFCSGGGGGIPACLAGLQAHTQGGGWGVWLGGVSRPTPRGEVEGSGSGVSRGVSPGPYLGGGLQAHTRGVYPSMHWGRHPPQQMATTGMHSCFFFLLLFYMLNHPNIWMSKFNLVKTRLSPIQLIQVIAIIRAGGLWISHIPASQRWVPWTSFHGTLLSIHLHLRYCHVLCHEYDGNNYYAVSQCHVIFVGHLPSNSIVMFTCILLLSLLFSC